MMMSCLFTDLSWLHISRIIIRAGATGTATHLVIVILTLQSLITTLTYHPEARSTELVEGLLQGAVLQEVPGGVPVAIQTSVRVTALVQSVLQEAHQTKLLSDLTCPTLKTSLQRADFPQTRILPSFLNPVVDMSPLPIANVPL